MNTDLNIFVRLFIKEEKRNINELQMNEFNFDEFAFRTYY